MHKSFISYHHGKDQYHKERLLEIIEVILYIQGISHPFDHPLRKGTRNPCRSVWPPPSSILWRPTCPTPQGAVADPKRRGTETTRASGAFARGREYPYGFDYDTVRGGVVLSPSPLP